MSVFGGHNLKLVSVFGGHNFIALQHICQKSLLLFDVEINLIVHMPTTFTFVCMCIYIYI